MGGLLLHDGDGGADSEAHSLLPADGEELVKERFSSTSRERHDTITALVNGEEGGQLTIPELAMTKLLLQQSGKKRLFERVCLRNHDPLHIQSAVGNVIDSAVISTSLTIIVGFGVKAQRPGRISTKLARWGDSLLTFNMLHHLVGLTGTGQHHARGADQEGRGEHHRTGELKTRFLLPSCKPEEENNAGSPVLENKWIRSDHNAD